MRCCCCAFVKAKRLLMSLSMKEATGHVRTHRRWGLLSLLMERMVNQGRAHKWMDGKLNFFLSLLHKISNFLVKPHHPKHKHFISSSILLPVILFFNHISTTPELQTKFYSKYLLINKLKTTQKEAVQQFKLCKGKVFPNVETEVLPVRSVNGSIAAISFCL